MVESSPRPPSLRGFWLLCGALALALVVGGATLVRAEGQLARVDALLAQQAQAHPRVDEALAGWGATWLEGWLRDHHQDASAAAPLERCMHDFLYALDRVSVSGNVVRHGPIERARGAAERCAAQPLGREAAAPFVQQLQARWGAWLEERGDTAPRFTAVGER